MKLAKKLSACVLSVAVMAGVSGCIPSPFEQNVPATTYTVDENGNKVKVKHNASTEKTEKEVAGEAITAFYNEIYSGNVMAELEKIGESEQEPADFEAMTDEEKSNYTLTLMEKHNVKLLSLIHISDDKSKEDQFNQVMMGVSFASMLTGGEVDISVEVDPHDVIIKGTDTAAINPTNITMTANGESGPMGGGVDLDAPSVIFTKIDGKWLYDISKTIDAQEAAAEEWANK